MVKKLRKLEVLAATDKETITVQQKKMHVLRAELEEVKQNYSTLKQNYDKVAAINDDAQNQINLKDMQELRQKYQAQLQGVRGEKDSMQNVLAQTQLKVADLQEKLDNK